MANVTSSRASSRRSLTVIILLLGAALAIGTYFLFVAPARSALSKTNSTLAGANLALSQIEARVAAANGLGKAAGKTIYTNAKALDGLLPQICTPGYETNCFNQNSFWLGTIPNLVTASGMSVTGNPTPVASTYKTLTYYQFTVTVGGSFSQLTHFVTNLTSSQPLVTVPSISASATPTGVTATVVLDVWYVNNLAASNLPSTGPQAATPAGTPTTTLPLG